VGGQVGDRSEVRVDRELVAGEVVAGGLVLKVARRSGPVAGGNPGDVGEIDGGVGAGIVIGCDRLTVRPVVDGRSAGDVCAEPAIGGALGAWERVAGRSAGSSPALPAADSVDGCRGG